MDEEKKNGEEEVEESEEEMPFREGAVDKLSSPEQLDRVMIVVKPKGWIAMLALLSLIILGIIWSFVGHIPIEVDGKGIILTEKGIFSIYSTVNGLVEDVPIEVGEWVTPKTVVARIYDQAIIDKMNEEALKKDQKEVFAENKTKALVSIYSPEIGKIIEKNTTSGSYITVGTSIAWAHHPLEEGKVPLCHAYFRVKDGEQIKPGMSAKMGLENIDTQTYGYLVGRVVSVSEFPVSDLDLFQVLRNEQLISFMKQGAPTVMSVIIEPTKDANDPSGFKWTSEKGPNSYVKIGSICDVKIITEDKKPISYIFPFWFTSEKETLGPNPNVYPENEGHK